MPTARGRVGLTAGAAQRGTEVRPGRWLRPFALKDAARDAVGIHLCLYVDDLAGRFAQRRQWQIGRVRAALAALRHR